MTTEKFNEIYQAIEKVSEHSERLVGPMTRDEVCKIGDALHDAQYYVRLYRDLVREDNFGFVPPYQEIAERALKEVLKELYLTNESIRVEQEGEHRRFYIKPTKPYLLFRWGAKYEILSNEVKQES